MVKEVDPEVIGSLIAIWRAIKNAAYTIDDQTPIGYHKLDNTLAVVACDHLENAWITVVNGFLTDFPSAGDQLLAALRLASGAWPNARYGIPEVAS